MTEVVRIRLPAGAGMAQVRCYQARGYISSLPRNQRSWDAGAKVWLVDISMIKKLTADLRRAGFTVITDSDAGQAPSTWADGMYEALPPALADQAGSGHRRAGGNASTSHPATKPNRTAVGGSALPVWGRPSIFWNAATAAAVLLP